MNSNELVYEYITTMQAQLSYLLNKHVTVSLSIGNPREYDIKYIIQVVCNISNVSVDDVISKRISGRDVVEAKQLCWLILREQTRLSLVNIAKYFGGKSHTTILAGIRNAKRRIDSGDEVTSVRYNKAIKEITKTHS